MARKKPRRERAQISEGEPTMAERTYTPPPQETQRVAPPSAKEAFTTKLTTFVNSDRSLAVLTQEQRNQLIVNIVNIAYPTVTSTQQVNT